MIVAYLHDMGINPDVFVLSSMTAPESVLWLSGKQMLQLGLANNGVLPVVAKYKLVNGKPYLLLEQGSSDGDHKIALLCVGNELRLDSFYIVGKARAKEIVDRGTVSYFEIDGKQILTKEQRSFQAVDNSVVLDRTVNLTFLNSMLQADTIGAYVNDKNGFLRTGFTVNIVPVRSMLSNYLQNCRAALQ
jgi:hypothetical protein